MRCRCFIKDDGFTLIEMVVVMAVFTIVLMISAKAFQTVLSKSRIVTQSEESNIEGVVGLEMMRHDLVQAGFGLFNDIDPAVSAPTYAEADAGIYQKNYNDAPNGVPWPIRCGNNISTSGVMANTDYLAIKATSVGTAQSSQKWTYIDGSGGASKTWSQGVNDLQNNDYVVAVTQAYKDGEMKRRLLYSGTTFAKLYRSDGAYTDLFFKPNASGVHYFYYGIDTVDPRAPFNRTDYYVGNRTASDVPASCAPGAGVLYKATMIQDKSGSNAGLFTTTPVLDCVASMQVVLGWNPSNNPTNSADTYTNANASVVSSPTVTFLPPLDATYIREHLKLIKVYILAQDGGFDPNYTNTNNAMVVGDTGLSENNLVVPTIDLTDANHQHYRWKLYRIVIRPKNII